MPSDVQQSFIDESALKDDDDQDEEQHPEYEPEQDEEEDRPPNLVQDEESDDEAVPEITMEETAAEETASVDEPVETSAEKRRAQALDDYPAAALRRVELRASGPTRGEGATPIELRAGESSSPQRRSAESRKR